MLKVNMNLVRREERTSQSRGECRGALVGESLLKRQDLHSREMESALATPATTTVRVPGFSE